MSGSIFCQARCTSRFGPSSGPNGWSKTGRASRGCVASASRGLQKHLGKPKRRSGMDPMRWATPSAYVTATSWSSICGVSAIRSTATTCPTFRHFARTLKKFLRVPQYKRPWPPKVFKFLRFNSHCGRIQMTKLVLYHYPMSLCSQKVRLCLAELGLSYVPRPVDIGFGVENFEPWYIRLNPAGVVPTLCDGERIVTNSAQILRYLAMRTGEGLPSDARQRAAAEHWLTVADAIPQHCYFVQGLRQSGRGTERKTRRS